MTKYLISADGLGRVLMADLYWHLLSPKDPERSPRPEIVFEDGAVVGLEVLWTAWGKPDRTAVIPGDNSSTVQLPELNEFLPYLQRFCLRNRQPTHEKYVRLLESTIGTQTSWEDSCQKVTALPEDSAERRQIVTYVKALALLDLGVAIVADMSGDRVQQEIIDTGMETPKPNPILVARLATFTGDWADCLNFARDWCKLLDLHYGEPEGSAFSRVNGFLQHLKKLAGNT